MVKPNVLVLTGYGINCGTETQFAFQQAGAKASIVHINDLINGHKKLGDHQILAFP
ncbi:MAG: phosphoribosylformylglycinamidine synthase subunit PurQ, partial [Bacteroidetes bacterium]|nr:phosphoribosylformylglycinamidine synthase subunit PurQ [Bacteroidota bacterium]